MCDLRVEERNEFFESAHAAIEIRYEEGRGRFAVAAEDIDMGVTLFREKPLTYTLNPEKFGTHCQHCFQPIRGVVPCQRCTWVCYCSSQCRSKANASYHKYECGIIKLVLGTGLNIYAYMALRLVTKEGLKNLLKMKDDLENNRSEKSGTSHGGSSDAAFYSSNDFRNAYNLMAQEDSINPDMWLLRGLVAVFLLKCLQLTDFFDQVSTGTELTPDELFVGGVLFR